MKISQPTIDDSMGDAMSDVIDALGDTVAARIELAEQNALKKIRTAVLTALEMTGAVAFVVVAWVCAMAALGFWLSQALDGVKALLIVATLHALLAGGLVVVAGRAKRKNERSRA